GTGTVRLSLGDGHARAEYPVRFRTAPVGEHDVIADGAHRYAPTAALHFEHDGAVVTLSENASPDHVRQAVASSLAEAQAIADHRFAGTRFDGTSVLVEGAIPAAPDAPRLSPTDLGRLAAMRVVDGDLDAAVAAGDGAWADQVRADALGMATRYGLADPPASVFTYGDNRPIVGSDAVGVRHGLIDAHGGGVDAVVHGREGAPARDWGPEIDRLRAADKEHLAQGVRDLVAQRDAADRQLTARLDADGAAGATHLFDRLIIGDGWAATEDFLTLGPEVTGAGPDGLPRVLAIGDHGDPWLRRGVLEMGQVPAELELPGAPFQPGQFAPDGNGFTRSMDFGHAVAAGRALSDMPTYHATATRIEPRPAGDAPGWPDGARYRVHVDGRPPLYARSVDVAAGPGPARIPGSGAHVPPRLVDAGSGYSADLGGSAPVYRDPHGNVVTAADLPAGVPARFGIDPHGAALPGGPHLADGLGRLTDPRLVDAASGYSVDPGTRALYDPAGNGVDAGAVPPDALARLGFGPDGFTDPRPPLRVGDYLVHPGTGDIAHAGDPGARIDPDSLPPDVRARIDGALATQRVQFGGQNMSGDYQPGDRILVYGAGAS
ncbi:MAG TPA: hypothetical protein VHA75_17430, partial [Rugosimonospora sp.]|nr:hypothetical protein [Rugosimonospora sp.]